MESYTINWTESLITKSESNLQAVHGVIKQFLKADAKKHRLSEDAAGSIEPCGSFLTRTTTMKSPFRDHQSVDDAHPCADICVTMPTSACSLDDVQEGRYLERRQQFVSLLGEFVSQHIKKAFPEEGQEALVLTKAFQNDPSKQYLRVSLIPSVPNAPVGFGVDIHVRPSVVGGRIAADKSIEKHPLYSFLVLEDFFMLEYLKKIHEACISSQPILRAIIFLKCWAAHNGLIGSTFPGALNGFAITAMVVRLLEDGTITTSLSEENIVRAFWVQLSRSAFTVESVPVLKLGGIAHNMLFRTSQDFLQDVVQRSAEAALQLKAAAETFHTRHTPLVLRFDVALTLRGLKPVPLCIDQTLKSANKKRASWMDTSHPVSATISRALGPRKMRSSLFWLDPSGAGTLLVNVASEARSTLNVGPPIENNEEVKSFDAFWGAERTSTVQFPDGSIHRCVKWSLERNGNPSAAALFATIVQTALQRHGEPNAQVGVLLGPLEQFVHEQVGGEFVDAAALVAGHLKKCVQNVSEMVERLPPSSLPCKIISFDVVSPSARGCEPFAARPNVALTKSSDEVPPCISVAPTIEPISCVLTIDDKHKIPDTLEAIAMMKGAICAQVSKALQASNPGLLTMCTSQTIDVILSGYLFRIYIAHYREVSLLKALQRDAEAAFLERKLFWTPRHTVFIRALANNHSSFQMSVRLARRWVSAMYLGEFLLAEAVELLVAEAYLRDKPPTSPQQGFTGFLQLIASFDWKTSLVLPTVSPSEISDDSRSKDSAMWIIAPYSTAASPFSAVTPRHMILHRLVALAKSSLSTLNSLVHDSCCCDPKMEQRLQASLFAAQETDFDVVVPLAQEVKLNPDRQLFLSSSSISSPLRRFWRADEISVEDYKKYVLQLVELEPVAQCLRVIRARTRDRCMVFADNLGPTSIACILLSETSTKEQKLQLQSDISAMVRGALVSTQPTAKVAPKKKPAKPTKRARD
ncbi:nucleolar rna-associated protein, putative [Bodo saltans]|uniref:Nucleolar rna-associated protein, putative n=1 Tax=Bodo saltans TaxID=75058 RepID=A0A0S4IVD7_BODSA|nr:nucleolar rna-associated protein, putative [Bodo saltans]|eukprot:CUG17930.1 nucleolar rna-associated protein, putative [Bodo saltans]